MTAAHDRAFDRLERYVELAKASAERGNFAQAMADVAEVAFISRQLWDEVAKANIEKEKDECPLF